MTHRERIISAFEFRKTDRVPYDITRGAIWKELGDYYDKEYGLKDKDEILDFADTDFRQQFRFCNNFTTLYCKFQYFSKSAILLLIFL